MRKALCVGINYYAKSPKLCLDCCINDATRVANALWRNEDGTENFKTRLLCARNKDDAITRHMLKDELKKLFADECEVALFYYSGHGAIDELGGYLCTSDIDRGDDGLSMDTLLGLVANSKAQHKIIILDSCHSGFAGKTTLMHNCVTLPSGTTILAACGNDQYSVEVGNHGVFTAMLLDGLNGGAMNLLGEVSPGSIYSYIESSLGSWKQNPEFKANTNKFICLRRCKPPITRDKLRKLKDYFNTSDHEYLLDPSYEEDKRDCPNSEVNKAHEAIFADLRKFAQLNLVVPVGEEYMYWAAVNSKACKLTALGQYYWNLASDSLI